MNIEVMFKSSCDIWKTPDDVYKKLNEEFCFDFDPCPLNEDPNFDGLNIDWGSVNFVNPLYSKISDWCKKSYEEFKK